jgi:leader peptidase (prepilin peptidase) / N-methyltransferase
MSVTALLASSPGLYLGTALILGLVVGSFLNVVIYRLPVMLDRQWREQCAEFAYTDPVSAPGLHGSEPHPPPHPLVKPDPQPEADGPDSPESLGETHLDLAAPHQPYPPSGAQPAEATPVVLAPARFNLAVPRSACPHCTAPITALQNIPLVSWLFLGGRCARCRTPIPARYPLIEALTGVLTAAVAWKFGWGWPAGAALVLTWFLIALTFIDVDHQLLPDCLTLPLMWSGLVLSLLELGSPGAPFPADLRSSVLGAISGYVSLWSVYHLFRLITGKEGMGYGDFKLFAALGAWLGWQMLLPVILLAASSGAIVGILLIAVRGRHRSTPIAFGPFLATAGWLVLMCDRQVAALMSWAGYP